MKIIIFPILVRRDHRGDHEIIDMDCNIGNNVQIINKDNKAEVSDDLYSIRDGIIIIPKNTTIPDNMIL